MTIARQPAGPDYIEVDEPEDDPCFPEGAGGIADIGLALSGGGNRALLFHLGALIRLAELGYLQRIDRISSVSGGSILAAILAQHWNEVVKAPNVRTALCELVGQPALGWTSRRIDVFLAIGGLIPSINPADLLARQIRLHVTEDKTLQDLPDEPVFVLNAASVATGLLWRFRKAYMGDWRIGIFRNPTVPLSRAVAASAAFPPFASPLVLDLTGQDYCPPRGADLGGESPLTKKALLFDGGAYDNLGLQTVEGKCKIVLASDAGSSLRVATKRYPYRFWTPQLLRTLGIAIETGRAQRRRALIDRANAVKALPEGHPLRPEVVTEHVALWRTSLDVLRLDLTIPEEKRTIVRGPWPIAKDWNRYLASRRTRLWPMARFDRERLVNWGYITSDLMLRRWVPELQDKAPPTQLPFPDADFESSPPPTGLWQDFRRAAKGAIESLFGRREKESRLWVEAPMDE